MNSISFRICLLLFDSSLNRCVFLPMKNSFRKWYRMYRQHQQKQNSRPSTTTTATGETNKKRWETRINYQNTKNTHKHTHTTRKIPNFFFLFCFKAKQFQYHIYVCEQFFKRCTASNHHNSQQKPIHKY